jgi:16S rRNA (cytosine967-C5)-methyltransferase
MTMSAPISPARSTAYEILRLVEGGGYASELLRSRTNDLTTRDAGLASELVFGVLRFQAQLDYLVEHFSGQAAAKLDREVRLLLRMGIYQLRYLNRVPPHAVVSDSVELVKRAHKRSAAGLVNAVLRRVDREPVAWPNRPVELSAPEWLLENWRRQFGEDGAAAIARAFLKAPERYVRVPESRRAEAETLRLEDTEVPGCYRVAGGGTGAFRLQDISSQAVVGLLELEPGQTFLDVCAAPGNKTAQALESSVRAVAGDVNREKLAGLEGLGAGLVVLDAVHGLPFSCQFDRILLDAPCSGTGTLGRNPEIKWRLQPADLERCHGRQVQMLTRALELLAPGGRLVYSTCSLEFEENEQVVEEALETAPETVQLDHMVRRIPGIDAGDGFFAAVLTSN